MRELLNYHKLRLLYTRNRLVSDDTFETMTGWDITGDWHVMTVDTNVDKSSGLDGGLAVNSAGSWTGGKMKKKITLDNYGEILFEHYLQNGKDGEDGERNRLYFTVDGVKKLEVTGPSPWQRCVPIGLTPGEHTISFEYTVDGSPSEKKGVVDTVMVWEGADVDCLVAQYTPPKPLKSIGKNKVLRGFTRYQEMSVADTEITCTAVFEGLGFMAFMQKSDEPFYFVDEFGICYRGVFPETVNPKSIAMNAVYSVELTMVAGQKTGFGFC